MMVLCLVAQAHEKSKPMQNNSHDDSRLIAGRYQHRAKAANAVVIMSERT